MTRTISILLILAAPWLVTWAVCGFIAWNWNPSTWDSITRGGMVAAGLTITGYLIVVLPWSNT